MFLSLFPLESEQMTVGEKRYSLSLCPVNFHYSEGLDHVGTQNKLNENRTVFQDWSKQTKTI